MGRGRGAGQTSRNHGDLDCFAGWMTASAKLMLKFVVGMHRFPRRVRFECDRHTSCELCVQQRLLCGMAPSAVLCVRGFAGRFLFGSAWFRVRELSHPLKASLVGCDPSMQPIAWRTHSSLHQCGD